MHYKHKKLLALLCCHFSANWLLYGVKTFGRILILCSTLNFTAIHNSYAEEKGTLDTIIDILSGLTCETQGVGNLLRQNFLTLVYQHHFFLLVLRI